MEDINIVALTGRLTHEPQSRTTASGARILNFSIAVNRRVKDGNEWKDSPNYVDCVMFNCPTWQERSLHKGSEVAVRGELRWSKFTGKDGATRSKLEVAVDRLRMLSSGSQTPSEATNGNYAEDDSYGEEIPF